MKRGLQLLVSSLVITAGRSAKPSVNVSLRSSWPASPPLIEALYVPISRKHCCLAERRFSETVSLENPDAFFPLLDLLTDPDVLPSRENMSPEAIHQAVIEVAASNNFLGEPGSLASVEMNLALHAATPKIEAFYYHYDNNHNGSRGAECGSWVDWYGEVVCDIETMVHLAGTETIDSTVKQSTES